MKKTLPRPAGGSQMVRWLDLCSLSVCFLIGVLAGCFFAHSLNWETQNHLLLYLKDYVTFFQDGGAVSVSFAAVLWEYCRWPILVLGLGFSALGIAAVPAAFCVRGFLISFSASVFVQIFGAQGLLVGMILFGFCTLLTVPVLFGLGVESFSAARAYASGQKRGQQSICDRNFFRYGGYGVVLFCGAMVQTYTAPVLLRAVSEFMF